MWNFAVIGDPIHHSLSPPLHNYLMGKSGIAGHYSRIHVETEQELTAVIANIKGGELDGINITSPWKAKSVNYVKALTPEAESAGVINTIGRNTDGLTGHNTDIIGFTEALTRNFNVAEMESPVILGAGGAARAVLLGLQKLGFRQCTLLNRTPANAEALLDSIHNPIRCRVQPLLDINLKNALNYADLLINTLPEYGRKVFESVAFPANSSGAYFDLLYAEEHQTLVRDANKSGWNVSDGLDMLIYQGIEALEFWTGDRVKEIIELDLLRQFLRQGGRDG